MMKKAVILAAALGIAAVPVGAWAQSGTGASDASVMLSQESSGSSGVSVRSRPDAAAPISMDPIAQNEVTYLCGGVGAQEQAYMKAQAKDYDMMLTFATRKGNYLADVNVAIRDSKGNEVLHAHCDGPMMLVSFPRSDTYRVRAETAGYTQNQTVRVNAGRNSQTVARAVMVWPQQAADEPATASGSSGDSDLEENGDGAR